MHNKSEKGTFVGKEKSMTSEQSKQVNLSYSDWIVQLYQQALVLHWTSFKQWTFEHLQLVCQFDSGLWWSRSDLVNKQRINWSEDTSIYNLPSDFMSNYAKLAFNPDDPDPLNQHLQTQPGKFFSIWDVCPKEHWYQTAYYQQHCRRYAIENAISSLVLPSQYSSVTHIFSYYRSNVEKDFNDAEKQQLAAVFPHLLQAFRTNLLSGMSTNECHSLNGAVDRFGEIVIAEEGFLCLMKQHGLISNNRLCLPQLATLTKGVTIQITDLVMEMLFHEGMILIRAYPVSLLSRLSFRQQEVCRLIAKGLTNKDIARSLGIQVNTVNNHVQNILKNLKVRSREAATAYLIKQNNTQNKFI